MPQRIDPFKNFKFVVSLGGAAVGGFQTVSISKITGLNKATDVTMKRGIVAAPSLQSWLNQVRKRTVTLELKSETGTVVAHWVLSGTRVVKHDADPTDATDSGVPVGVLVLAADKLEFESS